ncbi:nascent polypeptide-associated complex subunit alpha, muscle-specific form [Galendromus occidentalis]|uniref:Nascent polypeptide-associated complex subunit alpha, muscle-specific form n=1 Tax=Galendromus occidentalis TaxID=34638 RepID=A0AAJ7WHP5_9ACAR|nr:nascent polypeptide-associated complex subunit alpha, muscle-specific form [Galendromus occidentalis]
MSFSFLDKLSPNTDDEEKDEFDQITCPNTFDDDSQVDRFFDTHKSTPSPKLRRSQRLKKKQNDGKDKVVAPPKKTVESKTPPKYSSSISSYGSCASSTPYGTPPVDVKKVTTTPGPPPRSLLKLALGNAVRNKALHDDVTIVAPPKRTGPRTSTPKQATKVVKLSRSVKENLTPPIAEEPKTVKKNSLRKSMLTDNSRTVVKSEAVKRPFSSTVTKTNVRLTTLAPIRVVAPRIDAGPSRTKSVRSSARPGTKPESGNGQSVQNPKKSISEKIAPDRPQRKKSLKTIVKKRVSDNKQKEAIKNRVALARKTAAANRLPAKTQKATAGQYSHVKSRVAEMINSGPAVSGPNVRDMKKRAADVKAVKKALHDKPFIPAGKVKSNAVPELMPGDLTVNGQTMAQFVKNFQYQTPPRYRSLKPTDRFQNTRVNHSVQCPAPTIPKSPKFATKDRRRNATKQV